MVLLEAETRPWEAEPRLVEAALQRHKNHRGQTARALGISPKTLYNKLKAWGLDEPTPRA